MATHETGPCLGCGKRTRCSADEAVFGIGDGCDGPRHREFCSTACFLRVGETWVQRLGVALEDHGDLFVDADMHRLRALASKFVAMAKP